MKNTLLIAVVALGVTATSCRKERTCDCKQKETVVISGYGAQTVTYNSSSKTTMAKQKKNEFKYTSSCFSTTSTDTDSGGSGQFAWSSVSTTENDCELN